MGKILFLFFLLLAQAVQATVTIIQFDLVDFNASPTTNRTVEVQYMSPFPGNVTTYSSSSNGYFFITNPPVGDIRCNIKAKGNSTAIPFQLSVTSTNLGLLDAIDITSVRGVQTWPAAGATAWSIEAIAELLANIESGGGGDTTNAINVVVQTNKENIVIVSNLALAASAAVVLTNTILAATNTLQALTNIALQADIAGKLGTNSGSIIYVRTNGNNGTAVKGRTDLAYATPAAAIAAATSGDIISLSAGSYTVATTLTIPSGVTFIGNGNETELLNGVNLSTAAAITLGNNCVVANLKITHLSNSIYQAAIGTPFAGGPAVTNFHVSNITSTNGGSDVLYFITLSGRSSGVFENCNFSGTWDICRVGATNGFLVFKNCDFASTADITELPATGMSVGQVLYGTNLFFNCRFTINGTPTITNIYGLLSQQAYTEVIGCSFNIRAASGGVYQDLANTLTDQGLGGRLVTAGSIFNPAKTLGGIESKHLMTTGGNVISDSTNVVYIISGDVTGLFYLNSTSPITFTNSTTVTLTGETAHWAIKDGATVLYTNDTALAWFTNGTWTQVNGETPLPVVTYGQEYVYSYAMASTWPLTSGVISNLTANSITFGGETRTNWPSTNELNTVVQTNKQNLVIVSNLANAKIATNGWNANQFSYTAGLNLKDGAVVTNLAGIITAGPAALNIFTNNDGLGFSYEDTGSLVGFRVSGEFAADLLSGNGQGLTNLPIASVPLQVVTNELYEGRIADLEDGAVAEVSPQMLRAVTLLPFSAGTNYQLILDTNSLTRVITGSNIVNFIDVTNATASGGAVTVEVWTETNSACRISWPINWYCGTTALMTNNGIYRACILGSNQVAKLSFSRWAISGKTNIQASGPLILSLP